jgi:hypothetical protein
MLRCLNDQFLNRLGCVIVGSHAAMLYVLIVKRIARQPRLVRERTPEHKSFAARKFCFLSARTMEALCPGS